jgi:MOSC domain-containing protein YiiM
VVCDTDNHGGNRQAVYAYAREDLDWWQSELDRPLRSGVFGENLTTVGLDITEARIGETLRVGGRVILQITGPRIPCATFAAWMDEEGWLERFTRRARPGAYLQVVAAGQIRVGDPVMVEFRPDHDVSVGMAFRALTLEPKLLPGLLAAADYLEEEIVERAETRQPFAGEAG